MGAHLGDGAALSKRAFCRPSANGKGTGRLALSLQGQINFDVLTSKGCSFNDWLAQLHGNNIMFLAVILLSPSRSTQRHRFYQN